MKISPSKFERLIRLMSAGESIDPLLLSFTESGMQVNQGDQAAVLIVIGKVDPINFKDYESIGDVEIFSKETLSKLTKAFQGEDEVSLAKAENKIVLTGSYEELGLSLSTESVLQTKNFKESEYGTVLSKPEIYNAYLIDPSELKIGFGDLLKFKYNQKELAIEVSGENYSYQKNLKVMRSNGDKSGVVNMDVTSLDKILAQLKGTMWIIFTNEPLMLTYKEPGFSVSYAMAPRVV